jgi:hypothetical protein
MLFFNVNETLLWTRLISVVLTSGVFKKSANTSFSLGVRALAP